MPADPAIRGPAGRLPLVDKPPFWAPTTHEALEAALGLKADRQQTELADGWQLAFFSAATGPGRTPVWGWVRNHFGLFRDPASAAVPVLALTHLPSGFGIIRFADDATAVAAAAILDAACDWSRSERDAFVKASPVALRRLEEAGFVTGMTPTRDGPQRFAYRRPLDA